MRQRKAFTLVEMMVVVGLIVVLIALAVTGYSKLVNASAERATATALQNAQSLLAEYEQAVGLGRLGFASSELDTYIDEVRQHRYREEADRILV